MNADGMMEKVIFISDQVHDTRACTGFEISDKAIVRAAGQLHKNIKNFVKNLEINPESISDKNHVRITQTIALIKKTLKILKHSKSLAEHLKANPSKNHKTRKKASATRRKKNILIIEDEEMVRDVAINALKTFGYITMEACDGEMGINIYKKNHMYIDIVLLDIIMPKLSGTETFKQIRRINPDAKIIVTSGHITSQDQKKMFAGAAAYLDKPYQIMQLKKVVESVLD